MQRAQAQPHGAADRPDTVRTLVTLAYDHVRTPGEARHAFLRAAGGPVPVDTRLRTPETGTSCYVRPPRPLRPGSRRSEPEFHVRGLINLHLRNHMERAVVANPPIIARIAASDRPAFGRSRDARSR